MEGTLAASWIGTTILGCCLFICNYDIILLSDFLNYRSSDCLLIHIIHDGEGV